MNYSPKSPPAPVQFLLSFALMFFCGLTIMWMWGWYIVPLGLPAIGLFHAMGLDLLLSFMVTTKIENETKPFWEHFISATVFAALTLLAGWIFHFFM